MALHFLIFLASVAPLSYTPLSYKKKNTCKASQTSFYSQENLYFDASLSFDTLYKGERKRIKCIGTELHREYSWSCPFPSDVCVRVTLRNIFVGENEVVWVELGVERNITGVFLFQIQERALLQFSIFANQIYANIGNQR